MKTLSIQRPLPSMLMVTPVSRSTRLKASLVNWLPWSVLKISGALCRHRVHLYSQSRARRRASKYTPIPLHLEIRHNGGIIGEAWMCTPESRVKRRAAAVPPQELKTDVHSASFRFGDSALVQLC